MFLKILKLFLNNLLVFLASSMAGLLVGFFLAVIWINVVGPSAGLGIIALGPVMMILFSLLGAFFGGLIGLIIYNLLRLRKKSHR